MFDKILNCIVQYNWRYMKERTYKEIERLTIWADGIIQGLKLIKEKNQDSTYVDEFFYFNGASSALNIVYDCNEYTATVFDRGNDFSLNYKNRLELKVRQ